MIDPVDVSAILVLSPPPLSREAISVMCGEALRDVIAERVQQIDVHGFDRAHDLGHHPGELALASASYLNTAIDQLNGTHRAPTESPDTWPWTREAWRPGDARANLIKAIAIAWAVVDRIEGSAAPLELSPEQQLPPDGAGA